MQDFIFITLLLTLLTFLYKLIFNNKTGPKLPPGPRPLPIIGNFHMLGQLPYRSLAKLAQKYGPIMSLRLGQVQTIVISSPQYAELVLKQYDAVLCGRPDVEAWLAGKNAMAFTPYGDYTRRVRLMCTQHLMSATKVAEFEGLRRRETTAFLRRLAASAVAREVVDMNALVGELMENLYFSMIVGKGKEGESTTLDLKGVVRDSMHLGGKFNLGDFIPILRPLDLQGITRKFEVLRKTANEIFHKIIEDHLEEKNFENKKDILSTILDLINNENDKVFSSFSRENVKAIIYELFAGGIETTLTTIIWALSALIKDPRTLRTLQQELDAIIGKERMVKESDLRNLSYLDMVVKETFRFYSIGPLLIPHESMEDVVIDGYMIPKKSRVIVNIWAIGHDPKIWSENVEEFYPERFMNNNIGFRGNHFEFLPFGAGRRGCPGWLLGLTSVRLVLANLVHCFNWELPNGMQSQELDMTEKNGMATTRANNLLVVPSTRLHIPLN